MNRLEQYRQQYPQFKDTSDENLLKIAHSRHYKDMDFEDFKQKALAPVEQTEEARAFTGYLKDVGVGAVRGVTAAAEELGQFASEHFRERDEAQLSLLTRGMSEDDAQQLRQQQRERMGDPLLSGLQDLSLPNIGDPETFPGQATKAVSQFLTGFTATGLGSGKFKNMSNAARYGYTLARGAVTEYAFFDPYDGNFSNFLTEIGVPKNVVSDLLSVDPDDAVGTARAKNAVTGTVLGVVADKFIDGVMSVRRAWSDQSAKRALKEADEKAIDAVSKDPSKDLEEVLEYRDSTREYVPQEFREVEPSDDIVNLMSGRQEGTNEVDRFLGSWKFDNIDAPSEAKAALELGAKEYRLNRKVMSIDETYEAARKMGWSNSDIERLTKEVQDFPALVAYTRDVATTRMNALKEVAQKAEFGGLEDLARFDEEFAKVMMLFDSVTQQASAAGRAVRMYREMAKDRSGHLDELREILKARGGEDKFRDLAKTMSILDDPLEAIKSGRQIYKDPTLMDGVSEWIINQSFLSGPATQVKNIQGNILMNVLNMAERGVAAGVGSVRRKATGASDGVTGKEALAYSAASFRGFVDGGKHSLRVLEMMRLLFVLETER